MSKKQDIEEFMKQGLMTEAGLQKIELAKQNGSWSFLDAVR